MGIITLKLPTTAARAIARKLQAKHVQCRNDSRTPRMPRNGLRSPVRVKPAIGLSPPASSVRMVTGFLWPIRHLLVDLVLLLLGRQPGARLKQKLGPHQPDAIDVGGIETLEFGEPRDVDHELDPLAACGEDGSGERTAARRSSACAARRRS